MNTYEEKLKNFMQTNKIEAKHLTFQQSCHTVEEAAKAANANIDDFVKNICMVDSKGNLIVTIIKGEDRASARRVEKILNIKRPKIVKPEDVLKKTGYPCGGVPSFGYSATFLIDPTVFDKTILYTGGGSENSLVKIASKELLKSNNGKVVRVRK